VSSLRARKIMPAAKRAVARGLGHSYVPNARKRTAGVKDYEGWVEIVPLSQLADGRCAPIGLAGEKGLHTFLVSGWLAGRTGISSMC
jgi:hypothetical protein